MRGILDARTDDCPAARSTLNDGAAAADVVSMAFDPSLDEQALLAATFERPGVGMAARELVTEVLVGVGFAAATVALWVIQPPQAVAIAAVLSQPPQAIP